MIACDVLPVAMFLIKLFTAAALSPFRLLVANTIWQMQFSEASQFGNLLFRLICLLTITNIIFPSKYALWTNTNVEGFSVENNFSNEAAFQLFYTKQKCSFQLQVIGDSKLLPYVWPHIEMSYFIIYYHILSYF